MRRAVITFVLLTLSLFAEPNWTHSLEEAQEKALKEGKSVMIMFSKENCQACWYMENIVFKEEAVHNLIMDNFIPVYVDIHKDFVPDNFSYIGTPTFYFLDTKGEKISPRIDGASNVKEFTKKLNKILQQ